MTDDYEAIVIGGGAPGEHCAAAIAAGGLRVAVVERELLVALRDLDTQIARRGAAQTAGVVSAERR